MKAKKGHRYYEERTRLETVIPLKTPFILFCDPSSVCNLKCEFCPCGGAHSDLWTEEKRKSIGIMNFDLYKKIIDDCQEFPDPIKVLRLYKEGEPLANPRFSDMVAYAKESGKFQAIDTTSNAVLLNPELNRKIVEAGLTRINISVEGLNSEEYEKVCGKKIDYARFVDNIRDLYEHKGDCHIFVKMINAEKDVQKSKEREEAFYQIFGDICDEIAFEQLSPCWPGFDKEFYSGEKGIYGNNKVQEHIVCPRIFYIMIINSDGAASQCIVDWNRKMIIGDVRKNSVKELWAMMDPCRLEHLRGNRRKMVGCDKCMEIEATALDNIDDYREQLLAKMMGTGK